MATVSAQAVKRPRKRWWCGQCGRAMTAHVRLYGNADDPDPKYVLRICPTCAADSHDPKVIAARAALC